MNQHLKQLDEIEILERARSLMMSLPDLHAKKHRLDKINKCIADVKRQQALVN